jgi:hypothetical protein
MGITRQSDLPRVSHFVRELGACNDSDPVTMGSGSQAILEIHEGHEQIRARQSDFLHHVAPYHAPRADN